MHKCNTAPNPAQAPRLTNAAVVSLARKRNRPQALGLPEIERMRTRAARKQRIADIALQCLLGVMVLGVGLALFMGMAWVQAVAR